MCIDIFGDCRCAIITSLFHIKYLQSSIVFGSIKIGVSNLINCVKMLRIHIIQHNSMNNQLHVMYVLTCGEKFCIQNDLN